MEAIDIIEIIINLSLIIGVIYVHTRIVKAEKQKQNQ